MRLFALSSNASLLSCEGGLEMENIFGVQKIFPWLKLLITCLPGDSGNWFLSVWTRKPSRLWRCEESVSVMNGEKQAQGYLSGICFLRRLHHENAGSSVRLAASRAVACFRVECSLNAHQTLLAIKGSTSCMNEDVKSCALRNWCDNACQSQPNATRWCDFLWVLCLCGLFTQRLVRDLTRRTGLLTLWRIAILLTAAANPNALVKLESDLFVHLTIVIMSKGGRLKKLRGQSFRNDSEERLQSWMNSERSVRELWKCAWILCANWISWQILTCTFGSLHLHAFLFVAILVDAKEPVPPSPIWFWDLVNVSCVLVRQGVFVKACSPSCQ